MKTIEERKKVLVIKIVNAIKGEEWEREMLNDFYYYWTEMNEGGRKMRFEKEKVFDVKRRLMTWKRNSVKFGTVKNIDESKLNLR